MEISFPAHTVQDRIVSVSETDLANLYDILKQCFLSHLHYHDFSRPCFDYEKAVIELCKKYQVDCMNEADRVAFFEALLGVSPLDSNNTEGIG